MPNKDYLIKVKSYYEDLVSVLENLIDNNISRKKILNHPDLPIYFARNDPNWSESSRQGLNWIEVVIQNWYRYLKRIHRNK